MRAILLSQEEYDNHVLSSEEEVIFNEKDEYVFFKEFDPFHTRDQIRVQIEEYNAALKAGAN